MIAPSSISPGWWGRIRCSSREGGKPQYFLVGQVKEIPDTFWWTANYRPLPLASSRSERPLSGWKLASSGYLFLGPRS